MKRSKWLRLGLLLLLVILPLSRLNTTVDAMSAIDNKYLVNFPDINLGFSAFMNQLNSYLSERIGGRGRIIQLNEMINDRVFTYMEHALYEYGSEGYVFAKFSRYQEDYDFLEAFSDYLLKIQNYCNARSVPFVYLLNPSKEEVYQRYLPPGYLYQNKRKEYFVKALEEKEINYLDNSEFLKELSYSEQVFNRQYDANHWNNLGAFYGVNNLLRKMKDADPTIQLNEINDYNVSEKLITELPVSNFRIHEYVPVLDEIQTSTTAIDKGLRDEVRISSRYRGYIRTTSEAKNNIELLMFQGSYFFGQGHPFISRAVQTYQAIHNYDNLLNFEYYFNVFQPDFVVVTTAEYATTAKYFSYEQILTKEFNSNLVPDDFVDSSEEILPVDMLNEEYLTTIWFDGEGFSYGYFVDDKNVYDLIREEDGRFYISTFRSRLNLDKSHLYLVTNEGRKLRYKFLLKKVDE